MELKLDQDESIGITQQECGSIHQILSYYEKTCGDKSREAFIRDVISGGARFPKNIQDDLSRFSLDELIKIIYMKNYKVILTPEENLVAYYGNLKKDATVSSCSRAQVQVVLEVLSILGKKIKGINA
ncbi:hypothetical protein [Peribacillus asahii]|uniref:hypothetical protein n=1 Tax=Peribacillus asahii TaxID=228899 RepID=UPI0038184219